MKFRVEQPGLVPQVASCFQKGLYIGDFIISRFNLLNVLPYLIKDERAPLKKRLIQIKLLNEGRGRRRGRFEKTLVQRNIVNLAVTNSLDHLDKPCFSLHPSL